jgi:hypothetical protein
VDQSPAARAEEVNQGEAMKHIFIFFIALLLAPLAAPMNFQGLETVRLHTSRD